jgi:hypothetical protein
MMHAVFRPTYASNGYLDGFAPFAWIATPTAAEALQIAKKAGLIAPVVGYWNSLDKLPQLRVPK